MRLNKYLALCGVASRRKCDEIIQKGEVAVNGTVVTEMGYIVNEKKDKVFFNGNAVCLPSEYEYYKLNKPKGVVTTALDPFNRKTVLDLVQVETRIFPVGRLDYDTEGLLLLTNDGEIANFLTHPKNQIEKTYIVRIEGQIKESELAVLRNGVVIDGEKFGKSKIKVLAYDSSKNETRLEVKIYEGKNKEVRRMFGAIGKTIVLLKRVSVGEIKLGNLKRGEFRKLNKDEISYLNSLLGVL